MANDKQQNDRQQKTEQKKKPEIIKKIYDFFKSWENPDGIEGGRVPIKVYQLIIYEVSYDFVFKWIIDKKDFIAAADYVNVKLKKNQRILHMNLGEYNIELEYLKDDKHQD